MIAIKILKELDNMSNDLDEKFNRLMILRPDLPEKEMLEFLTNRFFGEQLKLKAMIQKYHNQIEG